MVSKSPIHASKEYPKNARNLNKAQKPSYQPLDSRWSPLIAPSIESPPKNIRKPTSHKYHVFPYCWPPNPYLYASIEGLIVMRST